MRLAVAFWDVASPVALPRMIERMDAIGVKGVTLVTGEGGWPEAELQQGRKALEAKGYIDRASGRSRGLRIIDPNGGPSAPPITRRVPLLGRIAAGLPIHADENVESEMEITEDFPGLASHRELFALRISGESMIGDGIFDGDLIFVTPTSTASTGSIVVALIDDEATVKRYYPENGRIRLEASNPEMDPIYVTRDEGRTAVIQGIVVGVYRKI